MQENYKNNKVSIVLIYFYFSLYYSRRLAPLLSSIIFFLIFCDQILIFFLIGLYFDDVGRPREIFVRIILADQLRVFHY